MRRTYPDQPADALRCKRPSIVDRTWHRWGGIINVSISHQTMRRAGFSSGPSKAALESETIIWTQDVAGSGVTVNALFPGGATLTGMIPNGYTAALRAQPLPPDVMVQPLVWRAAVHSNGITGMRFKRHDGAPICLRRQRLRQHAKMPAGPAPHQPIEALGLLRVRFSPLTLREGDGDVTALDP